MVTKVGKEHAVREVGARHLAACCSIAAAFGIPKAQLAEGVLSFSAYQEMLKQRPGTRSETKAVEAQYVEYKARWQTVNTALYWHVRPSLDIDGVHFLADSRALEDLYSVVVLDDGTFKSLADGRGLIKWATELEGKT